MIKKKTVLVVCGLGVATSTVAAIMIEEEMKKRGITVHTIQCKASEMPNYISDVDLIVATTQIADNYPVPVIRALTFITGIGKEETINQIAQALSD